jgi:hypothetical protein
MRVARPFKHDCARCVPVGWFHDRNKAYNIYFCKTEHGGSIIMRYGDDPQDYASYPVFYKEHRMGRDVGGCSYGPDVSFPKNAKELV